MKNRGNKGITVIHNDVLAWMPPGTEEGLPLYHITLDTLLDEKTDVAELSEKLKGFRNTLSVVAESLIAKTTYEINTKKQSVIDHYIQRKLGRLHPDLPDIKNFFSSILGKNGSTGETVYAYYMLSPESYQVYQRLEALGQAPERITTPAYLWQKKLNGLMPDFEKMAVGLICIIEQDAYIYFYFKGFFLFSRNIRLPENQSDDQVLWSSLNYEINQSLYLFSQKTKTQPDNLFLISSNDAAVSYLSEHMDRKLKNIKKARGIIADVPQRLRMLGTAGYLGGERKDFSRDLLSVSHRIEQTVRQWKPVQMAGIYVGILLFIMLSAGNVFLHRLDHMVPLQQGKIVSIGSASREILEQYTASVDTIMQEVKNPAAGPVLYEIVNALPAGMWLKTVSIQVDAPPGVKLLCLIQTQNMQTLDAVITRFLQGLGKTFAGARTIRKQDIRIEAEESDSREGPQYTIGLTFGLI